MIEAKLAAPAAIDWLKSTAKADLLFAFDRSLALINDDGKLLAVVLPEIGPGPFSIVIDPLDHLTERSSQLRSTTRSRPPIEVAHGKIEIADLVIDTSLVQLWEPKPDWENVDQKNFLKYASDLKKFLALHGSPGSLSAIIIDTNLDSFQSQINDSWLRLSRSLLSLENGQYKQEVAQITGLGHGLTPAGDDFLMGIIMALWAFATREMARTIAFNIVSAAKGRTTKFSEAYLETAGRGEANYAWHELVKALANGNRHDLHKAAVGLMKTGETSGSDALTGFILAGEVLAKSI